MCPNLERLCDLWAVDTKLSVAVFFSLLTMFKKSSMSSASLAEVTLKRLEEENPLKFQDFDVELQVECLSNLKLLRVEVPLIMLLI